MNDNGMSESTLIVHNLYNQLKPGGPEQDAISYDGSWKMREHCVLVLLSKLLPA